MFEGIKENPVRFIKTFAMDLVVVAVAVAYVFYSMVGLKRTEADPWIILAQSIMGIICGIVIKQALGENGFSRGYNSTEWEKITEKYNDACDLAEDYTDRLDNFYLNLEKEKRENYRRAHLQAAHLKYNLWFNADGDYIGDPEEFKKLSFYQKHMVRKSIKVKIYVLNLFSEYSIASEQDTKKEVTDKTQRRKNATKNTFSAVAIAVIGVYFIPFLSEWSWASFISSTLQVLLWILFGIIQLFGNYDFVVTDRVAIIRKKMELISRFIKDCKNGKYLKKPYEQIYPIASLHAN